MSATLGGVQVACIAHFQKAPLSHLAVGVMSTAAEDELQLLLDQLPKAHASFIEQEFLQNVRVEVRQHKQSLA